MSLPCGHPAQRVRLRPPRAGRGCASDPLPCAACTNALRLNIPIDTLIGISVLVFERIALGGRWIWRLA